MSANDEVNLILAEDLPKLSCGPAVRNFRFCETRKFEADWALPHVSVLIEVEGGLYPFTDEKGNKRPYGAHRGVKRMESDMEKYNLAASLGFRVYRFTPGQVRDGTAIQFLKGACR